MYDWPEGVRYALDMLLLASPPQDAEFVGRFLSRWHGFDIDRLQMAVASDDDLDSLFSLFVLSYTPSAIAIQTLLPILKDPDPAMRWASALGLGHLKEELSLPSLHAMLTQFLPPTEESEGNERWYFRGWRFEIPEILSRWGRSDSVPPLRNALEYTLRLEDSIYDGPHDDKQSSWDADTIRRYENVIVYALGRLGSFGALTGLMASRERLEVWRIHLLMGHLHGKYEIKGLFRWRQAPQLRHDVESSLERLYGMSTEAFNRSLLVYEQDMSFTVSELYRLMKRRKRT